MVAELLPIIYSDLITVHDTNGFDPCRAILVGVAGEVKVTYENNEVDTIHLVAGVWHPMIVKQVFDTGTTATGIHAGY